MNVDGSYWKPEQYPKTTWDAAKGPPVYPSTLSGSLVLIPLSLMNPLTPIISCLRIKMVKCFPGLLELTAGTGHL